MLQAVGMRAFRVPLDQLRAGPRRIEESLGAEWLGWALDGCEYRIGAARGDVRVELEPVAGGVLLSGRARMAGETECGICLACARIEVEADISGYLMPEPEGMDLEEERELTPEDLEREWYKGYEIILDEIVRDAIMLELPMTPRCIEDCRVPRAAAVAESGRRIDPRLAPLAEISKKHEGE